MCISGELLIDVTRINKNSISIIDFSCVILTFDVLLALRVAEKRIVTVETGTIPVDGDIGEKELASLTFH